MSRYRLTVRAGPKARRERFDDLDEAIEEMEREATEIRRAGRLADVKMLRTFEAGDRVAGRLELSTGGMLRGTAAGIDVMGDGELVAFTGGMRREKLKPRRDESPFDAVRKALRNA